MWQPIFNVDTLANHSSNPFPRWLHPKFKDMFVVLLTCLRLSRVINSLKPQSETLGAIAGYKIGKM